MDYKQEMDLIKRQTEALKAINEWLRREHRIDEIKRLILKAEELANGGENVSK